MERLHWVIVAMWLAYPATIALCTIIRRQVDRIAPPFDKED